MSDKLGCARSIRTLATLYRDMEKAAGPRVFEPHQGVMRGVWLHGFQRDSTQIIEVLHELRRAHESFRGGDILDPVSLPQAIGSPERRDTGFCRETRSRENHQIGMGQRGHAQDLGPSYCVMITVLPSSVVIR